MKKISADRIEALIDQYGRSLSWVEVVKEARNKKSPLHSEFEWNKDKAHELYLRERAQALLREWYTQVNCGADDTIRVRRLVSLPTQNEDLSSGRRYYRIEDVLPDHTKRDLLLQQALQELSAFRRKYAALSTLANVFAEIDRVEANAVKKAA